MRIGEFDEGHNRIHAQRSATLGEALIHLGQVAGEKINTSIHAGATLVQRVVHYQQIPPEVIHHQN